METKLSKFCLPSDLVNMIHALGKLKVKNTHLASSKNDTAS